MPRSMIKKIIFKLFVFSVILVTLFSNLPIDGISQYLANRNVVDKFYFASRVSDVVDNFKVKSAHAIPPTRSRTVEFFAGQLLGTAAGQNTNTVYTFPTFNVVLSENTVSVKNAFIEFEGQIGAYVAETVPGFELHFDSCVSACTPAVAAFVTNTGGLGTNSTEAQTLTARADVTAEAQLAAYTGGGTTLVAQVGYKDRFATAQATWQSTQARLIITYTYDDTSVTQTNTVYYPLESQVAGDQGSRGASQATGCTLGTNCPKFNYNIVAPEIQTQRSQWFAINGSIAGGSTTTDYTSTARVDTNTASSNMLFEEALSLNGGGYRYLLSGLTGHTNNAAHYIERTGSPHTVYVMGGETALTYSYLNAAATKTKTVRYPVGEVITAANSVTKSALTGPTVYLPETGVAIQKAWFRITTSYGVAADTLAVTTKVDANAETAAKNYSVAPPSQSVTDDNVVYHVIPSADYAALQAATATTGVPVQMTAKWTTGAGAVSAELVMTYTYTSEANGYQVSLQNFAGQHTGAQATTFTTATGAIDTVMPEATDKTIRGAFLKMTRQKLVTSNEAMGANLTTGACTATSTSTGESDTENSRISLYKDVTSVVTISDAQTYTACYSAGTASTFTGALVYTYQWAPPPAAAVTIGVTAGSKATNLDSGATSQYANVATCNSVATCSAFTLSIDAGSDTVTSVGITVPAGQTATTNLSNLALFYDTDGNYSNGVTGQYGATVASLAANGSPTAVSGSLGISSGTTYYFYVRFDLINGANNPDGGETVQFEITNNADVVSGATETGAPKTMAGTTTVRPNTTSFSNSTEPALTDGARETQTISVSGYGFGTTCNVGTGSKVSIGANDLSCTGATFNKTTITIAVDAALPDTNNGGTGASGLLITIGATADDVRQTFYVYPDVTSLTVPTAVTDAAREYNAADSDGVFTVNGTHFGAAGTVTILGSTGTQQTTATCTGTAYQATCVGLQVPTAIADGSYTGNIVLTRTADSKTDTYAGFRVLPRIASTAPINLKGGRGDTISVAGDHLCQSGSCPTAFSATNKVSFNGGEVTSGSSTWTDTSIPSVVIPGTAIDGNLNITSNTSYPSNNLTYNIKFAPTTPTNSAPTNGATGESKNPTLTASNFDDGTDGDTHSDSQWQITKLSGDYTAGNKVWEDTLATAQVTIVVNSTNGTFTNTTLSTELNCNTTYWWHVRHKDNAGVTSQEWSAYSGEFSFTTASCGPDATSVTNNDEPALTDGGRIGHINIVVGGSGFGTVNAGSRANCAGGAGTGCVKVGGTGGQTIADARVTAWANTSITIQLSLTDLTTTYGGATTSGLIVYAAGVTDSNGLTFYVYPDVTSLTAPLGTNDGAREYSVADTDGIITITGNKFGSGPTGGSVVIVGGTVATFVADGTCDAVDGWAETCIKIQVPTTISDSTDSGYAIVTQGTGSGNKTTSSTDTQSAINIWPRVTSISAASFSDGGYQNGTFTLNGNHFGAVAGLISVNGQTQDGAPTWGAASITGVGIPNTGTDSGNIILTKSDTKTSNTFSTFYIYPQITGFTNETDGALVDGGRQAHLITISGNHFGTGGGNAQIVVNGVVPSASTPTWGATSITGVDIPNSGTDSGVIVVTNPQTTKASNNSSTFYIYPTITSLTVPTATTDAAREYLASDSDGIITVNGNHFGVAGTVTIIGSTGTQQTTATCTGTAYQATCVGVQIPTAIADNSYTGNATVSRTSDSKDHAYAGFRVLPRITSLNPNSGATNDPIIVIGNHLCQTGTCPLAGSRSTASDNVTFFNGVQVTDGNVTAWGHGDSSTSGVNVNVPSAAATGNIVVTSNTYASNGVSFTKLSSAPADPTNLLQFKTSNDLTDSPPTHDPLTNTNPDGKISTGGGINQTNTWLRSTAQAGISATLCIQVEIKTVAVAFDGTGTIDGTGPDGCKSFTVGTPVKLFVNVPSLTDSNSYKWRSRIQNQSTLEYSNWVNAAVDGQSKSFYIDTSAPSSLNATCPPSTYTASTADISWTPVDSVSMTFTKQVQYDTDSSFVSSSCTPGSTCGTPTSGLGANPQTTQLTGLAPSSVYYYRVRSKDAAGNEKVEGYGLSGNSTCTFTTSKAEMRTAEYIITGETGALSSETLRNFQVYLTEQGANIQNAFVEISGIASANASNLTLGLKAVGSADPGYTNYTVATSATVSTPFTVLHRVDPTASGLYIAPTQSTNNVLYINPTGGPSMYIASAKIIVTYYYTP